MQSTMTGNQDPWVQFLSYSWFNVCVDNGPFNPFVFNFTHSTSICKHDALFPWELWIAEFYWRARSEQLCGYWLWHKGITDINCTAEANSTPSTESSTNTAIPLLQTVCSSCHDHSTILCQIFWKIKKSSHFISRVKRGTGCTVGVPNFHMCFWKSE